MGNSWFQFKQFTVQQDKTAMKVCTDSCVFGALIPVQEEKNILDIGTGTGLLSLMLAQRSKAYIDAVELEAGAAEQASENFLNSPWHHRLRIHHISVQDYFKFTPQKYDLIVSNPPFFSGSLKSTSTEKNMAFHQSHLTAEELIQIISFMLKEDGNAYLLISIYEEELYLKAASNIGLNCRRYRSLYDHPEKKIRYVLQLSLQKREISEQAFIIREKDGAYTSEFKKALADFYLAL